MTLITHRNPVTVCSTLKLVACASTRATGSSVKASLQGRSGSKIAGTVPFVPAKDRALIDAGISDSTPGDYGFHTHESGDCSAANASSAKGHFNPVGKFHGQRAEDMPDLIATSSGNANVGVKLAVFERCERPSCFFVRCVVVHANPNDYKFRPAGNSDTRVACGSILLR